MTKVLIVDDSSFMRKALTHILKSDESLTVVGTAADGEDALRQIEAAHPDVVLLDLQMPGMDGLTTLEHIVAEYSVPVLVVSGLHRSEPAVIIKALERGAVDYISKPSGLISYDIDKIRDEIIHKVKVAASAHICNLDPPRMESRPPRRFEHSAPERMVVIGASTGGPRALANVLRGLPRMVPSAVLVVQHLGQDFIPSFADRLKWGCALDVAVARNGEVVAPGRVLVAPGGCHTLIVRENDLLKVRLSRKPSPYGIYPCIDHAMTSAAKAYGNGTIGVLLTGMGHDGASGMKAIKEAGGCTIAEDQSTCLIFGMPKAAMEAGCVDKVVPLPLLAQAIMEMLETRPATDE